MLFILMITNLICIWRCEFHLFVGNVLYDFYAANSFQLIDTYFVLLSFQHFQPFLLMTVHLHYYYFRLSTVVFHVLETISPNFEISVIDSKYFRNDLENLVDLTKFVHVNLSRVSYSNFDLFEILDDSSSLCQWITSILVLVFFQHILICLTVISQRSFWPGILDGTGHSIEIEK